MAELLIFLHVHNKEKFGFNELNRMNFFSSPTRLSETLKFCVSHNLIVKTNNDAKRTFYEIKAEANIFAEWLMFLKS